VATANGKTSLWIGFASSLSCALLVLLWIVIGLLVSATEPKWPGQPLEYYGTLHWIFKALSGVAGWLLMGAVLVSAFSMHEIAERDRKRTSAIAIVFTVASVLLVITSVIVQRIYAPLPIAGAPTNYARAILAAPPSVGWLLENELVVMGVAAVLFGAAFVLFGVAMQRDQLQAMARRFLVPTGTTCILAGLSLSIPVGLYLTIALCIAMALTFAASNAVLSVMFLRMRHNC
jgi:hypothetical protein